MSRGSFFVSETLKGRLTEQTLVNERELEINNVLSIEYRKDKIFFKLSVDENFKFKKKYSFDKLILNGNTCLFNKPVEFDFVDYQQDLNLKISYYTIVIEDNKFWSALEYEWF